MKENVVAAWPALCTQYEGRCYWLYLDTLNLPTTGLGYRVVDRDSMLSLPWYTKSNELATPVQIAGEWTLINSYTSLSKKGGFAFEKVANLRLKDEEIDRLLLVTTNAFWKVLLKTLPNLESWPADAQLALMDMAWNLGPNFLGSKWPNFTAAAKAGDFTKCAASCLRAVKSERDYRHQNMFKNAAKVVSLKLDPETLWDKKTPVAAAQPSTPAEPTPTPKPEVIVKHSKTYDCDYVWYGQGNGHSGGWVPVNLVEVLDAAAKETGKPVRLTQGGLNGTVSASAKTHMGLGAFDIAIDGRSKDQVWALTSVLLRSGIVAFPRGYINDSFQNMKHIHCASWDNYDNLHPQAKSQVDEFRKNRGDGLVGSRKYNGPNTTLEHWSTSPYNPKNIKKVADVYYVQTNSLLGLDADRKTKETKKKDDKISFTRQIKRWGRWNAVTSKNTYFAIEVDGEVFLKPKDKPVEPPVVTPPVVIIPDPPVVDPEPTIAELQAGTRDGTRGD